MRHPIDPMDVIDNCNCNCDQALALVDVVNRLVKERDEARAVAESVRRSLRAFRFPLPFAPPAFPWESDDGW